MPPENREMRLHRPRLRSLRNSRNRQSSRCRDSLPDSCSRWCESGGLVRSGNTPAHRGIVSSYRRRCRPGSSRAAPRRRTQRSPRRPPFERACESKPWSDQDSNSALPASRRVDCHGLMYDGLRWRWTVMASLAIAASHVSRRCCEPSVAQRQSRQDEQIQGGRRGEAAEDHERHRPLDLSPRCVAA